MPNKTIRLSARLATGMAMLAVFSQAAVADGAGSDLPLYLEAKAWIEKCPAWLDEVNSNAIAQKLHEREAAMQAGATPEQIQQAHASADQRVAALAKAQCDGAATAKVRDGIARLAFESRADLTSRAASLARAAQKLRWASRMTDIAASRPFLDQALKGYDDIMAKAGMTENWNRIKENHAREAPAILTIACQSQEAAGEGIYGCPPASQPPGRNAVFAEQVLKSARVFAGVYEEAVREEQKPGGTLAAKSYSKIVRADSAKNAAKNAACPAGTLVVNPNEEAPRDATGLDKTDGYRALMLYRLGERKPLGKITLMAGFNAMGFGPNGQDWITPKLFSGTPELSAIGIKTGQDVTLLPCE
ncbi:MAG: hypothetical protein PHX10_08710 [Gallionellaceae bacterium]|nr:hypothetical protein [Gallionellaceae bacterium]